MALAKYEAERKPQVDRFQRAAFESLFWFEGVQRYVGFDAGPVRIQPPHPLAAHLLRDAQGPRPGDRGARASQVSSSAAVCLAPVPPRRGR